METANQNTELNPEIKEEVLLKKDYWLGIIVGLLIGVMFMPVLKVIKPNLYFQLRFIIIPFFLIGTPLGLIVSHKISKLSKKLSVIWQLAKFVVTGIMNVLVDFGTLTIITILLRNYFHINSTDIILSLGITVTFYSLYKATSFTVSNINSYFWNKYWTFDKRGDNQSEFIQFFIVSIVGFIINVVVASFVFSGFQPFAGMNADQWGLIGAAAGSIAGLAWNFLGYKFIVFKK